MSLLLYKKHKSATGTQPPRFCACSALNGNGFQWAQFHVSPQVGFDFACHFFVLVWDLNAILIDYFLFNNRQRSRRLISTSFNRFGRTISRLHWNEVQRITARWISTMLPHICLSQCVLCEAGRKSATTNCTRTCSFGYHQRVRPYIYTDLQSRMRFIVRFVGEIMPTGLI